MNWITRERFDGAAILQTPVGHNTFSVFDRVEDAITVAQRATGIKVDRSRFPLYVWRMSDGRYTYGLFHDGSVSHQLMYFDEYGTWPHYSEAQDEPLFNSRVVCGIVKFKPDNNAKFDFRLMMAI